MAGERFRSGSAITIAGVYVFDGYANGTWSPTPLYAERVMTLAAGGVFPPIKSAGKACWWRLSRVG